MVPSRRICSGRSLKHLKRPLSWPPKKTIVLAKRKHTLRNIDRSGIAPLLTVIRQNLWICRQRAWSLIPRAIASSMGIRTADARCSAIVANAPDIGRMSAWLQGLHSKMLDVVMHHALRHSVRRDSQIERLAAKCIAARETSQASRCSAAYCAKFTKCSGTLGDGRSRNTCVVFLHNKQ
jgi:hypothetical protein